MLQSKRVKKELKPWRKDILSHHQGTPSRADRAEFPRRVIGELIIETDNHCGECGGKAETTHHVMPRGRGGRGVKKNGLRLCGHCHHQIQTSEERLQHWIDVFEEHFGRYFWFDEQDWEENRQRAATEAAKEAAQQLTNDRIKEAVAVIVSGAGRPLRTQESCFLAKLKYDELSTVIEMLRSVSGSKNSGGV
jgi:transcription elongation factor Elf1